jgi:hypothetical protein
MENLTIIIVKVTNYIIYLILNKLYFNIKMNMENVLTIMFYPWFRIVDLIFKLFTKQQEYTIIFSHYNSPYLIKKLYMMQRNEINGASYLNYYKLKEIENNNLTGNHEMDLNNKWLLIPTWRTLLPSISPNVKIDFSNPKQTTTTFYGWYPILNTFLFKDWFRFLKSYGVENITIEKKETVTNFGKNNQWTSKTIKNIK